MESDETLVAQLLGGRLNAFDGLYSRYERPLFAYAAGLLDSAPEAEEIIHDVFLALLAAGRRDKGIRSVRAWLFQATRNAAFNRLRARRRGALALTSPVIDVAPADGPETKFLQLEAMNNLGRSVRNLPDSLREVFELRSRGLTYEELADVLRIPLGTVKSRLHEIVRRLKREVEP
jgi:RNA polymerase sigma-70 factor (ECF subfamily)